jgi:hypothetical protein
MDVKRNIVPSIEYVCSLGTLCHTANLLKRNKLKMVSYPFDWIFSNMNMIIHCLETNFSYFLDKTQYIHVNDKQCGHKFYRVNDKFIFNHHNPLIESDYDYYVRCVDRFRELLKQSAHKLFVIMHINNKCKFDDGLLSKIIDFNNKFKTHTCNYRLLYIYHRACPDEKKSHHQFTSYDNIDVLEYTSLTGSSGVSFKDDSDNKYLDDVINDKYEFK